MIGYMLIVICIGLYFAKRAQANSENYFLGDVLWDRGLRL